MPGDRVTAVRRSGPEPSPAAWRGKCVHAHTKRQQRRTPSKHGTQGDCPIRPASDARHFDLVIGRAPWACLHLLQIPDWWEEGIYVAQQLQSHWAACTPVFQSTAQRPEEVEASQELQSCLATCAPSPHQSSEGTKPEPEHHCTRPAPDITILFLKGWIQL